MIQICQIFRMSGRHHHSTTTIIGLGLICMTILGFIVLAHNSHSKPPQYLPIDDITKDDFRELQSKFDSLTKQYESLYEYKERLEKSYLHLKNEASALIDADKREKIEFTELKELYSKQVQTLQDDLRSCRDQLHSIIYLSRNNPKHNNNNELNKISNTGGGGEGKRLGSGNPEHVVISSMSSSSTLNQQQQQQQQQQQHYTLQNISSSSNIGGGNDKSDSHLSFVDNLYNNLGSLGNSGVAFVQNNNNNNNNRLNQEQSAHIISQNNNNNNNIIQNIANNILKEPIQSPIAQVPMEPAQPSSDPNQDLVGNVLI